VNFNFCSFAKGVLTDEIRIIANQLYVLGHRAYEGSNFIQRQHGYNILVGDVPKGGGDAIIRAGADGALFINLTMFDGNLYIGNVNGAFPIELGYAKTSMSGLDHVPGNDFGVFGPLTPTARKMVKKLHRISNVRVVEKFTDKKHRDTEFLTVRVVLQLYDGVAREISGTQCNVALHMGRPVIAQTFERRNVWNDIVKVADPDKFVADCMGLRLDWKNEYQRQFTQFVTKLTPEFCISAPFKQLGINLLPEKSVIHA
jgi:hypothetical protein